MPRRDDAPPLTRGVVARSLIFAVAVALGAVSVWLIVTGKDLKANRIGVLAGLWGLLLGTFALIGSRRGYSQRDDARSAEPPPPVVTPPAKSLEVRSDAVLERQRDAEERRVWREQLEAMIRREVQDSVSREVSSLRSEIASLRSDLLEKVGGQLRLERIETTRVIGSDLEALQHEVRQLKNSRDSGDLAALLGLDSDAERRAPGVTRRIVEPAQVRPVSRQTHEVEDDVQPARWTALDAPGPFAGRAADRAADRAAEPAVQPVPPVPRYVPPPPAPAPPPAPLPPVAPPPPAQPPFVAAAADGGPTATDSAARSSRHSGPEADLPRRAAHAAPAGPPRHSFATGDTGPVYAAAPPGAPISPPAPQRPVAPPTSQPPTWSEPARPATPVFPPPAEAPSASPHWAFEDGLESLPRLTPFTDIDPDPVPPPRSPAADPFTDQSEPGAGTHSVPDDYRGRRRRRDEAEEQTARRARHADQSSGRRRRNDDDADDNGLLAQLLERETAR